MKLFLLSHTINDHLIPTFEDFIGRKCKGLKVAFVFTAGKYEKEWLWKEEDYIPLVNDLKMEVDLIDIEELSGESLKKELKKYDVLWMNGGITFYLMKAVIKSGLKEFLPDLLNDGLIYTGSSAGSMICSKNLEMSDWYPGEEDLGAAKLEGLGYIDFQIFPHFEQKYLPLIKKNKPKEERYVLLKNGQAISFEDGVYKFYGENIIYIS